MPKVFKMKDPSKPAGAVYIGRGSKYGNPFPITQTMDRNAVCDKYEQMVEYNTHLKAQFIKELRGKDLVCYCSPLRCHGDYLLRIANE